MSLILYLIITAISGLFIGGLARLALPGRDPMSLFQTMLVGIAGSLIGGIVAWLLFHSAGGLFFSFAGAFLIVYLIRRSRGGSLTHPGPGYRR
jgi:uncharacterized membrane protein YeaQ/YmgE (transglycosylase-associated protein family)